jgi:hypothetical protein
MKEEPDWFKCNFTLGQTTSIGCYSGFWLKDDYGNRRLQIVLFTETFLLTGKGKRKWGYAGLYVSVRVLAFLKQIRMIIHCAWSIYTLCDPVQNDKPVELTECTVGRDGDDWIVNLLLWLSCNLLTIWTRLAMCQV